MRPPAPQRADVRRGRAPLSRNLAAGADRLACRLARPRRRPRCCAASTSNPARGWTIEELARETGVSRSVLAARFMRLVGCPPMQYLTRWRVQLAARLLTDGLAKVSAVGARCRLQVRRSLQPELQEGRGCLARRVARRQAQITRDSATRLNVRLSIRLRPQSRAGNRQLGVRPSGSNRKVAPLQDLR